MIKRKKRLKNTGLGDGDLGLGLAGLGALVLDSLDDVETFDDLAEDDVLAVEPRGDDGGDEELRAVGVGAGVGHGKKTGLGVRELEVLVFELGAVDRLASGTVTGGEVTTLQHEVRDDTVERRSLVTETVCASAQLTEVLGSLGNDVIVELERDATQRAAVLGDVEENVGHDSSRRSESACKSGVHREKAKVTRTAETDKDTVCE